MDIVSSFVAPALLGLCVGIFSGMLGIGGGTIMVPMFRLLFGMSPLMSTATSLFAIIPTSLAGAISHIRYKTAHIPLGLVLGFSGACTSPLGVWIAQVTPPWMVMAVTALVVGYSAVNMLIKAARMKPSSARSSSSISAEERCESDSPPSGSALQETQHEEAYPETQSFESAVNKKLTMKQLLVGSLIGLFAGLISGYVGVGGGFIMVPLMLTFLGIPMKKASGTSLIAIIILAIPGVIEQAFFGNIDYLVGIVVAIGSVPGALIGSYLLRLIPERTLRFLFGGFLIIAAILLALNEFRVLG